MNNKLEKSYEILRIIILEKNILWNLMKNNLEEILRNLMKNNLEKYEILWITIWKKLMKSYKKN